MTKVYNVEALVHKPIGEGFRVKVEIKEIGLFINGMVVYPPNEKNKGWQTLTPAIKKGFRWVHAIEFNSKLPLWKAISEACIEAVRLYIDSSSNETIHSNYHEVILEDIDDKPLDFSTVDIPF